MFAPDMSAEEFLAHGDTILNEIAKLLSNPDSVPVLSQLVPGDISGALPAYAPETHEEMSAILEDFQRILMPGMTHWNHPGFMAYFANSAPGPGILAETLTAALNQNAMLWRTSPAATELEETVMRWLAELLGIKGMTGVITDTASISSMLAMAAARENIPGLNIREEGLAGRPEVPRLRLYTSDQAHSSIEKGAIALGIGQRGVCKIPSDSEFRMDIAALRAAIKADRANGVLPFCVAATVGTTSTTSVDPVSEIADICEEEKLWLHVDAAYAGSAAIVPELRWLMDGCDRADSLVVNPHKWLFTPMDCSALYIRSPQTLRRAFSLVPDYLVTEGEVTNFMDWGVQLGRRFRALKLWMILRYFGREGLIELIRGHVALAQEFAEWIDASGYYRRTAPAPLSAVCFRAVPPTVAEMGEGKLEALNAALMHRINASGKIFLSHTKLKGLYTLRIAIGNIRTGPMQLQTLKLLLTEELTALLQTGEY